MPTLPTNPQSVGSSGHVNDHNLIVSALTVLPPIGSVTAYAGSTAPSGWALCYGQAISRTIYATLFAALGTTFGSGDGSTTFNLPDLRGRTIAGLDNMGGSDAGRLDWANTRGTAGGTQTHQLTAAESGLPSHQHTYERGEWVAGAAAGTAAGAWAGTKYTTQNTSSVGGSSASSAHNNMQPTLLLNWIIRTD